MYIVYTNLTSTSFLPSLPIYSAPSNPITTVQYSSTGDRVLAGSGSSKVKVFDRDGVELLETLRGDMYLVDMKRTKGHVAGISAAAWHPKIKEEFLTCASDG